MHAFELPADPLGRFLAITREIHGLKSWVDGWNSLRFAALGLVCAPGDPHEVSTRLFEVADELRKGAGWFGSLNGPVRYCVAATLLRRGERAADFTREVERVRGLFKEAGLSRGSAYEVLAILILSEDAPGQRVTASQVQRMAAVHTAMKKDHGLLTGVDDYPACAILSAGKQEASQIEARVERFYKGLADLKFQRGNQLQSVSHMLFFSPAPDDVALRRFRGLYDAFQGQGLHMNQGDYDEVGFLTFLSQDAGSVVERVLSDRRTIRMERPQPTKQEGFNLACNTCFMALAPLDEKLHRLTDVARLQQIQQMLQAQQAAVIVASGAASASAAS